MNEPIQPQKVVWDIEQDQPVLAEAIRAALREVYDPEIRMSVIQLGLIRNVQIGDEQLIITMIMTTPFCPYAPALIEQTKEKAQSASPYPVIIALGMDPWDFSMMEDPSGMEWGIWQ